jgi:RNA polymerase sigma-70 factor (ECF subfamily)
MIDHIRREKRYGDSESLLVEEGTSGGQYSDLSELLEQAVSRLPDDQRAVVMLRDYEGYSYREIADITNLSEQQVKVYIYRARVFLKRYIGNLEKVI